MTEKSLRFAILPLVEIYPLLAKFSLFDHTVKDYPPH